MAEPAAPRPVVVNVGITGHRAGALTAPVVRSLRPAVFIVFRQLRETALSLQQSEEALCSVTEARLNLHTALASGADQMAAICARSSGYYVSALLPFEANEYRKDFAPGEELDGFEQALEAADEIVALPGDRAELENAYVLVGQSLVRIADVMIAIWDGEQARGPGGTGHVVAIALENGVPVIHIDIEPGTDALRMRALMGGDADGDYGTSLGDGELYERVLRAALKLEAAKAPAKAGAAGKRRTRVSAGPA